ncbi:DUF3987 domain-containing protein [Emticicia agri]|uniref:DUF3987 domain-containing protein n=1 Tax=Emticicia agri TaxID=2492393 RepID=A0A4Q5LXY5_9BACT|nr:DUF3987 domain-containing protein [Emticicia agri]RYU94746.1 DUF3987 domain-containing protein [Emticicia agri]
MTTRISHTEFIEDIEQNQNRFYQLSNEEYNVEPFPIHVFPESLQYVILATHECLKYPIDFISSAILYAISISIGNTHKIKIKESWLENAVVYVCLAGRAGTNKSHPLSFALKPILDKDFLLSQKYKAEMLEYIKIKEMKKQEKNEEEPLKPILQKTILSDYTPEVIIEIHQNNLKGLGIYMDEFVGWFKNFNRYNKGNEQESWLSNWSGKSIISDRKTGDPIYISSPFISVIGTIQIARLNEIIKESRGDSGFIDRILFAIPDSLQKEYWTDINISSETVTDYTNFINQLLDMPIFKDEYHRPIATIVEFSNEAKELLFEWQRKNTDLCRSVDNESLEGIYSKLEVYISRFCLILQLAKWAAGEEGKDIISKDTIIKAIALTEYFRKTAEKVYYTINRNSPKDKLSKDKLKVYEVLPEKFKTEIGLKIALVNGLKERNFKNWLNDKDLFAKVSHGEYEKLY